MKNSSLPTLRFSLLWVPNDDGGGWGGMREMRDYKSEDKNDRDGAAGEEKIRPEKLISLVVFQRNVIW